METTPDQPVHNEDTPLRAFAPGVERIPVVFVNAYLVGDPGGRWVLVDTGMPGFAGWIRRAARARFGWRPPEAIVLTHGHFDHAGSAEELARSWNAPVYAHRFELPFLTGRSDYPPQDPTVGGALGLLSRTFPHHGYDLGERVRPLPEDGSVPGLPGWRWHPTPGHSAGHVSLFREEDRVLLAGDAFATVDQDSAVALLTQRRDFSVPPAPFTTDWEAARESVRRLAELRPAVVAAGHGRPAAGSRVPEDLARFAETFTPPRRGRYVERPAVTDTTGVVSLPPRPFDPLPLKLLAASVAAGALVLAARRRGGISSSRCRLTSARSGDTLPSI